MEGFSYVSNEMDLVDGKVTKTDKPQPVMNSEIKNRLLFLDFDMNIDFGAIMEECMKGDPMELFGIDCPIYKA